MRPQLHAVCIVHPGDVRVEVALFAGPLVKPEDEAGPVDAMINGGEDLAHGADSVPGDTQ